jgi:hypothetical protein
MGRQLCDFFVVSSKGRNRVNKFLAAIYLSFEIEEARLAGRIAHLLNRAALAMDCFGLYRGGLIA